MASTFSYLLLLVLLVGANGTSVEGNRPVSKVLTLLKDMVGQLQKEAEEDEKVKETMDCWCETGLKDKTQAISDNEVKIGQLNAAIESGASNSARLSTEIANLEKEIAENTEALEKATAMRQKQLAEFSADEKSMLQSIGQMKNAIETIAAKHEGSFDRASSHHRTGVQAAFLQQSTSASDAKMMEAVVAVQTEARRHSDLLSSSQRDVVAAFVKAPEDLGGPAKVALLQQDSAFSPAHSSSSGQIFGVLKGMKESFETNLAAAQKEETTNQADYEALKAAKSSEIKAGTDLADTKSTERGDTDQKHAQDSQDLEDTEATLAADQDFLKNLKEQCANVDAEYAQRTKTRNLEIQAVSKALAYLNSDDAADLYARTFGGSAAFLQTGLESSTRTAVKDVLAAAAERLHDPHLSALSVRVMSPQDAFDQVKQSIQDMVDKLVAEKEDEVKHKDFCVDSLQKNEADTSNKERQRDDHKYKIGELTSEIAQLGKEIDALKAEIAASYVSLKRAGEDRQRQNSEFQRTVADQRATQKLLVGALDILKGFYEKMSLVQHHAGLKAPAGAPPPPGFKKQENNASSGGVMGMMQQIIDDAKAMEAEALQGEEESQEGYESFVTELNASIVDMAKAITHKTETKATKSADKAQKEIELEGVHQELADLKSAYEDLHADCDYTLNNFDSKQGARDDEIQALKESISIFSGGSFGALLQTFKK